ncbi:MAG TPA: amphi-Trp domain-containing protein [Streptosporangiaceae bacterium]|jgi:amphi-Trp domain-containing protein
MSDVKVERKEAVSREEAASLLKLLSQAFTGGGHAEIPFGPGGTMSLRVPDSVRAELEVEIEGDEVEIELEFKWSIAPSRAATSPGTASRRTASAGSGTTRRPRTRTAAGARSPARKPARSTRSPRQ